MAQYEALCDSTGLKSEYYKKGNAYPFAKDPGKHFKLVEGDPTPPAKEDLPVPASYMAMTVAELAGLAEEKGVEIKAKWSKDKIIQAILRADAETDLLK